MNTLLNRDLALKIITSLLIILWVYTGGSKLMDFPDFKNQLHLQHFSETTAKILTIALPVSELLTAVLLARKYQKPGLKISLILLGIFTLYIILILSGYYIKVPCSCGGVLKFLGWRMHLLFNIFFLTINTLALYLYTKKERRQGKSD
ncbi:MauE/DoxX family redox-associated membrane protein [Pedobacter psychrodurus]|uniref:MauE/DoxX family redox-associated membrane protein n=1 Tax=Pedobacter psychrodurus TaxID=2530456 RepID=UPI00292E6306|nr:MauE/DoxX family redox-associated membrane protein [Pedobacter psychrodurus]